MIYSTYIQKAIETAAFYHADQKRKTRNVPYIIHPLGVALILSRLNAPASVIAAAILHDTLEDTAYSVTQLLDDFGPEVCELVLAVTEEKSNLSYKKRKQEAINLVLTASHDAQLIKSADALYNMRDLISALERKETVGMFKKQNSLWRYTILIAGLKRVWDKNPLLSELQQALKELSEKWKEV